MFWLMTTTIYPWHQPLWQNLQQARTAQKLGQAFLLTGIPGLGKLDFARAFAHALLCFAPTATGTACQQCRACQLLAEGSHPDLLEVVPEKEQGAIKIDAIRSVLDDIAQTSQLGGKKVVLIAPADAMNLASSNALLKSLEEPNPCVILLLVSDNASALPATVRSRTQILNFKPAFGEGAEQWLAGQGVASPHSSLHLAEGAPLAAQRFDSVTRERRQVLLGDLQALARSQANPLVLAEKWLKEDVGQVLTWILSWLVDIGRYHACLQPDPLINVDIKDGLIDLANYTSKHRLFSFFEKTLEIRRLFCAKANLNLQLMVEEIFVDWPKIDNPKPGH